MDFKTRDEFAMHQTERMEKKNKKNK